ncbi:MAG: hypothetical protein V4594_07615 [Bacteroidota bacterium]
MLTDFECRYFLDNTALCVIEIKNKQISQWLLINKTTLNIKPLVFNSMDTSGEMEEMFFDLGYLKFDPVKGIFIEKFNSGQHPLENRNCKDIPKEYVDAISQFAAVC